MTLTQIYSRYVESCDQLQAEKEENARLNNYLEHIMKELDEKTPALQKLRQDHDIAVNHCEELQQRLGEILDECEMLRIEVEDGRKLEREKERENKRLSALSADLSRQVKVLLRECEEARGGVTSMSHDISSTDITSSSQVGICNIPCPYSIQCVAASTSATVHVLILQYMYVCSCKLVIHLILSASALTMYTNTIGL